MGLLAWLWRRLKKNSPPSPIRNLRELGRDTMNRVTLTWTNPTTRVDGTSLDPTDIASIDLVDNAVELASLPGHPTTFTTDVLPPGNHDFTAQVKDTQGRLSTKSPVFRITVPAPSNSPPNPVTDFTAQLVP